MKTLTDAQKKWALTACLMTALSFNLSAHVKADKEFTLDLASEGIEFDVTNSKGVRDAKAWKAGDNGEYLVKLEAVPGCNCDPETVEIKVQTDKQGKDLANLIKVATYAKLEEKGRKAAPQADEDESGDPNEGPSDEEQEATLRERFDRDFKRILKTSCSGSEDEAKCSSKAFIEVLKKYEKRDKDKKPSDAQAQEWFESEVAEKLLNAILSEGDLEEIDEDNSNYYTQAWAQRKNAASRNQKLRTAKNSIESLIERIPKGYPETRRKLVELVKQIQLASLQEYGDKLNELSKLGPNEYQTKVATAQAYQQSMNNLNADLDRMVNSTCTSFKGPTCQAVRAGYITKNEATKIYREEYGSNISEIINNSVRQEPLQVNGRILVGPNGVPETRVIINPNILSISQSNGGNDSTMLQSRDLSNRSPVVVQQAPTNRVVYIEGKAYQEIGDVTTVEQTPSVVTTSAALKFFDEMDATQESLRQRQAIHQQYRMK